MGPSTGSGEGTRMKRRQIETVVLLGMTAGLLSGCAHGPYVPRSEIDFPALQPYVWQPLVQAFEKRGLGLDSDQHRELFDRYIARPKLPVRVAVVDLIPGGRASSARAEHSRAMTGVVRSVLCRDAGAVGECAERVSLARVPNVYSPASVSSAERETAMSVRGFVDTITGLLADFHPGKEHLVIGLGVALDTVKLARDDEAFKSLVEVLRNASCLGVLVVAPAGNATGSIGPLIPAAFETMKAPSSSECQGPIAAAAAKLPTSSSPLVYAVGAIDARDQPLQPTRPFAQPRLAAYGMAVSARVGTAGERPYTAPFSGTSMATAIVSGVAAAVWTVQPTLDPHAVMKIVYEGGSVLGKGSPERTDFCLAQTAANSRFERSVSCATSPVHRVELCGALRQALMVEPPSKDESLKETRHPGLTCKEMPVTAADFPLLPEAQSSPNPRPSPEACRISGCGGLRGPLAIQTLDGFIPQGPTVPTCPFCSWQADRQAFWGKFAGTLPNRAVLHAYSDPLGFTQIQSFSITPSDMLVTNSDGNFVIQNVTRPTGTASAAVEFVNGDGTTSWDAVMVP